MATETSPPPPGGEFVTAYGGKLNAHHGERSTYDSRRTNVKETVGASSNVSTVSPGTERLRQLAREGRLAAVVSKASDEERQALTGSAYALVWPIVFNRITRINEARRGHHSCMRGVNHLADACLDRFHDDVEAVVDDLVGHSKAEISNVEGWITSRLQAVTIDAHRRRRAERGAMQRPRLPGWLATELGGDPWLKTLAISILEWVGTPALIDAMSWPLETWAQWRAVATGEFHHSGHAVVAREVEIVLEHMRKRPLWYGQYVERPLAAKVQAATAPPGDLEFLASAPVDSIDRKDTALQELVSLAIDAIKQRITAGEDAALSVEGVLTKAFGQVQPADLDQAPGGADDPATTVLDGLLDGKTLERIVATICEIIDVPRPADDGEASLDKATVEPSRRGRPRRCPDETLNLIVKARSRGERLIDICDRLNTAGIPTPAGGSRWYPSYVTRLLQTRDARALLAEITRRADGP